MSVLISRSMSRLGTTRLTSPSSSSAPGGNRLAGKEHLERRLGRDRTNQGNHRRGAEQADLDARRRERRLFAGDRQVACRHELAAGRRGNPVHPRNHRNRQVPQPEHHPRAEREQLRYAASDPPDHLRQIVARTEGRPRALPARPPAPPDRSSMAARARSRRPRSSSDNALRFSGRLSVNRTIPRSDSIKQQVRHWTACVRLPFS